MHAAAVSSQFILLRNEDHLIGTERELYPTLIFYESKMEEKALFGFWVMVANRSNKIFLTIFMQK